MGLGIGDRRLGSTIPLPPIRITQSLVPIPNPHSPIQSAIRNPPSAIESGYDPARMVHRPAADRNQVVDADSAGRDPPRPRVHDSVDPAAEPPRDYALPRCRALRSSFTANRWPCSVHYRVARGASARGPRSAGRLRHRGAIRVTRTRHVRLLAGVPRALRWGDPRPVLGPRTHHRRRSALHVLRFQAAARSDHRRPVAGARSDHR